MGWWPFGKKSTTSRPVVNDPLLKDTRTWISELRDICEMNFDQPEEARRQIRQMQVEWRDAMEEGMLNPSNREGLESRAFRLLTCTDKEWLAWLDNLDYWKRLESRKLRSSASFLSDSTPGQDSQSCGESSQESASKRTAESPNNSGMICLANLLNHTTVKRSSEGQARIWSILQPLATCVRSLRSLNSNCSPTMLLESPGTTVWNARL